MKMQSLPRRRGVVTVRIRAKIQKNHGNFDGIREKVWQIIKKKTVEVLVFMFTAAITALTTTSCMGHDLIGFCG